MEQKEQTDLPPSSESGKIGDAKYLITSVVLSEDANDSDLATVLIGSYEQAKNRLVNVSDRETLLKIAVEGKIGDEALIFPPPYRYNAYDKWIQRRDLMNLFAQNKELATEIVSKRIVGGHGSTSGSLIGVLEYGLKPQNFLLEQGILVATGEGQYGSEGLNNTAVSYAYWNDKETLSYYAGDRQPLNEQMLQKQIDDFNDELAKYPDHRSKQSISKKIGYLQTTISFLKKQNKNEQERLNEVLIKQNFPIIYFTSGESIDVNKLRKYSFDQHSEYALDGGTDKEGIKIVCVPREKINFVKTLFARHQMQTSVFAIEDYYKDPPNVQSKKKVKFYNKALSFLTRAKENN